MLDLVFYLSLLIFFSFLLIKASQILVGSLSRLSKVSHFNKFGLASLLMSFTTSLPELFVCIIAALEKKSNLALGNIIGSNIADVTLVIGGAAAVAGSLGVIGNFLIKDLIYVFMAGLLPILMLLDGRLTKVEGLLLLAIYGVYNVVVLRSSRHPKRNWRESKLLRRLNAKTVDHHIAWFFLGAALLIFSADSLVRVTTVLAQKFNVPLMMVGLFLLAVATSLPELSFELTAARKKQVGMVFGDLLGSVVVNSTLILGLTTLINPIILDTGFKAYFWASIAFVIFFLLFLFFVRTKRKLERWEGIVLIILYFAFVVFEFWRASPATAEQFFFQSVK